MQFDKYSMYSITSGLNQDIKTDKVDECISRITELDEYSDIKDYLLEIFGSFSGGKWFDYPELNKSCYLYLDDEKVEFCALKNEKQYFGKGWKLIDLTKQPGDRRNI